MSRAIATPKLLLEAIHDPETLLRLTEADWERLLSCARRNSVLAYLCARAQGTGVLGALPQNPRTHLTSAFVAAARLAQLARWELDRVARVLRAERIPMVALKGVAYLLRGFPFAVSRRLADIDVMVPKERLDATERLLLDAGWSSTLSDPYDQQYYRRWSHELPPLLYPGRLLAVDVHHTICPPVSRLRPDPRAFWAAAESTSESGVQVLAPADSVLHAAVHLFFDSDFDGRFRDLVDLHELVTHFACDSSFWETLLMRAGDQGLGRPLHYAFVSLTALMKTNVPADAVAAAAAFRPPQAVRRWMHPNLRKVLAPVDPDIWPPANRGLLWLLYVRSLWLRMPARLLLPHLARKSLRRLRARPRPT